jgi:hypothetical protein
MLSVQKMKAFIITSRTRQKYLTLSPTDFNIVPEITARNTNQEKKLDAYKWESSKLRCLYR